MAEHPQPDLGTVLRHEAERHLPDPDVMLARIVQRRGEPAPSRWMWSLRPVAAAASVVATLAVGFAGIRLAGERPEPDRTPAATEDSPAPSPSPSPAARSKAPPREEREQPVEKPPPPPAVVNPTWQPADRFLASAAVVDGHSIGTWAQGNVTLTTTTTITALDVVINVAKTAGVEDAGKWTTIPADMLTMTVAEEKERLVYRFTLKQGTLAPGSYVFAVQYTHPEGERNPAGDTYGALATAGGEQAVVTGAFPAA